MVRCLVIGVLLTAAPGDMPGDVVGAVTRIKSLLMQGRLDDAEAEYQSALEAFPQDATVTGLRIQFGLANSKAGRHLHAAEHLAAAVIDQAARLDEDEQATGRVMRLSEGLLEACRQAERPGAAEQPLDAILAAVAKFGGEAQSRHLVLTRDLRALRAVAVAANGRGPDAAREMTSLLHSARQELAARKDVGSILHVAHLLRRRWEIVVGGAPGDESAVRREFLTFLAEQSERLPTDSLVLKAYFDGYRDVADDLATRDPDAAEAIVEQAQVRFRSLSTADSRTRNRARFALGRLAVVQAKIDTEKVNRAMHGKPAKPPVVRRWVNAEAPDWEGLRGRVVMLCFWSLASRGSLQALPQLGDWHEAFADDGLAVIGLTRHANVGWDPEKRQPRRVDPQTPLSEEAQDEGVRQFCMQTGVAFPVGVIDRSSETYDDYGVVAVPLVVLIDRQGRVRRVRLLTNSEARETESQIKQLLGKPAEATPP